MLDDGETHRFRVEMEGCAPGDRLYAMATVFAAEKLSKGLQLDLCISPDAAFVEALVLSIDALSSSNPAFGSCGVEVLALLDRYYGRKLRDDFRRAHQPLADSYAGLPWVAVGEALFETIPIVLLRRHRPDWKDPEVWYPFEISLTDWRLEIHRVAVDRALWQHH